MDFILTRGSESLTSQLFEQMKERILNGSLSGGTRLPSTRDLAEDLKVSRNIIIEVYDQLYAEGFVESHVGDGTYVVDGITFCSGPLPDLPEEGHSGFKPFDDSIIDFRSGLPDLNVLPVNKWLSLCREVYLQNDRTIFAYSQPEGTRELRQAIAAYTASHRGVRCHPGQILITGGTTQAIGIVSRLLLQDQRKKVCLEDPVTVDIGKIVALAGGNLEPHPVDSEGLVVDSLRETDPPAFAYVTPSHHFPLGVTMSIRRRIELIEYAREKDFYIIEDDYDSEFRYDVKPVTSLQGLDPQRVIYLGTFSKTLFPALRMGYIIFPPELISRGREQKWFSDLHNPVMDQLVLARFIDEGHFVRSVARMKKKHRTRRRYLISCLNKCFGDAKEILGSEVGIHMAVRFPGIRFSEYLLAELERRGVRVYPVEEHAMVKGNYEDTIILGYGFITEDKMERGIEILKEVISENSNLCHLRS